MDVTARLFFRKDVEQLGVAPLTSMFLFSEKNRASFDDFRPNVHDSDGLRIVRADGDIIWRPLNNPVRLVRQLFLGSEPAQLSACISATATSTAIRTRARITSVARRWTSSRSATGARAAVRLVEIPTDLEVNDNIVAFWVPDGQVRAGEIA